MVKSIFEIAKFENFFTMRKFWRPNTPSPFKIKSCLIVYIYNDKNLTWQWHRHRSFSTIFPCVGVDAEINSVPPKSKSSKVSQLVARERNLWGLRIWDSNCEWYFPCKHVFFKFQYLEILYNAYFVKCYCSEQNWCT